ncbi:MAG TPA: hypothetical protein VK327_01710 [Candidatus Paceibacterota bacterium]|nr:hypothetical protein [Candidatus Paceibacterota bacterium]
MKTSFALVGAAFLLVAAAGCHIEISVPSSTTSSSRNWKIESQTVYSEALPGDIEVLVVENHNGVVRIIGTDSGPGSWTQTLKVRAADELVLRQLTEAGTCKASGSGEFKLIVSPPAREQGSFTSDLEITVPKHVVVRAGNHYGSLTVLNINTNIEALNQCGSIEIGDIGGAVKAQTSYAAMTVRNCGRALLNNQCGSINASDVRDRLEAGTSYAALNVRRVAGPVKLHNQCGSVDAQDVGEAEAETSYGRLRLVNAAGRARLVNQCGGITADRISGNLVARTSYAELDVCASGSNLICENQSGRIKLRATSDGLKEVQARTSYAKLEVLLPSHLKPAIQARTSYAGMRSDFPVLTGSGALQQAADGLPRVQLENQAGEIVISGSQFPEAK